MYFQSLAKSNWRQTAKFSTLLSSEASVPRVRVKPLRKDMAEIPFITDTERLKVQWQADLGKIRDANTVQSITELTTASTHQQIALSARSRMPQSTLFDYLG